MIPEEQPRPLPAADGGLAADDRPTAPLPRVPPLRSVPLTPPLIADPPHAVNRRRLAVSAAVAVGLILVVAVPVLVIRLGSGPSPAAGSTVRPAPPASTAAAPDPTAPARDPAARAMAPPASEPAVPAPPAATSAPAAPAPTDPPPTDPPAPGWSTIVDNTTAGRFSASGSWGTSTDSDQRRGSDFRYATPVEASDPAWYRVDIPVTGRYRVDVWFPAKPGYNERTPYIVATTTGNQTIHISQQSGGGRWVSLGTFELAAGDADVVAVSRWRTSGTGYVIADAVRLTRQ